MSDHVLCSFDCYQAEIAADFGRGASRQSRRLFVIPVGRQVSGEITFRGVHFVADFTLGDDPSLMMEFFVSPEFGGVDEGLGALRALILLDFDSHRDLIPRVHTVPNSFVIHLVTSLPKSKRTNGTFQLFGRIVLPQVRVVHGDTVEGQVALFAVQRLVILMVNYEMMNQRVFIALTGFTQEAFEEHFPFGLRRRIGQVRRNRFS